VFTGARKTRKRRARARKTRVRRAEATATSRRRKGLTSQASPQTKAATNQGGRELANRASPQTRTAIHLRPSPAGAAAEPGKIKSGSSVRSPPVLAAVAAQKKTTVNRPAATLAATTAEIGSYSVTDGQFPFPAPLVPIRASVSVRLVPTSHSFPRTS
jgi:hypothetical protein